MAVITDRSVRPAVPGDFDRISHLISYGSFVHRHLDWRTPQEWIGFPPYFVIEQDGQIRSVLACPEDPPLIGWVRIFGTDGHLSAKNAWDLLWTTTLLSLNGKGGSKVAVIILQDWFREILENSGFDCHQEIVMLTWMGRKIPGGVLPGGAQVREMLETDLPRVAELDAIAFDPLWQNSTSALHKAYQQAALATIVVENDVIIAYQISTKNLLGGHLARLAVHPLMQGKGIGHALVVDMIQKLNRSGVTNITVNTQSDNVTSLALYKKIGFMETGERYPVFVYDVK